MEDFKDPAEKRLKCFKFDAMTSTNKWKHSAKATF